MTGATADIVPPVITQSVRLHVSPLSLVTDNSGFLDPNFPETTKMVDRFGMPQPPSGFLVLRHPFSFPLCHVTHITPT